MNKRIITLVSVAVIPITFLVWVSEWAIVCLMPYNPSHSLAFNAIEVVASLLLLPVRLYAFFVYHDHGSWSLPVLILLLAMSCLMWGVIMERVVWLFSKRKAVH